MCSFGGRLTLAGVQGNSTELDVRAACLAWCDCVSDYKGVLEALNVHLSTISPSSLSLQRLSGFLLL